MTKLNDYSIVKDQNPTKNGNSKDILISDLNKLNKPKSNQLFNISMAIFANVIIIIDINVNKIAMRTGINVFEFNFQRTILPIILIIPYILQNNLTNTTIEQIKSDFTFLSLRIIIGIVGTSVYPLVLQHMSIGDLNSLISFNIFWTTMLAQFVLHERVSNIMYLVVPMLVVASILIARPPALFGESHFNMSLMYIQCLLGAILIGVCKSCILIILRRLKNLPPQITSLSFSIVIVPIFFVGMCQQGLRVLSWTQTQAVFAAGCSYTTQNLVQPLAMQYVPAMQFMIIHQLNNVIFQLCDIFLQDIEIQYTSQAGAIMIIVVNFVYFIQK